VMHFQSTAANGHDWAFGSNFILGQGEFGIYDYTANASRLFIAGNGNVGIGSSAPAFPLDVKGNANFSSNVAVSGDFGLAGNQTISGNTNATGFGSFNNGVLGTTASTSGVGVSGNATATSGGTAGVFGFSASGSGYGVYGEAPASTGIFGVSGGSSVYAGQRIGVLGASNAAQAAGVLGHSTDTSGGGLSVGTEGVADGPSGTGILGKARAATGSTTGVEGDSASSSGTGVAGYATALTGNTIGVGGYSASTSGNGVIGKATATNGVTYGVVGNSVSTSGAGVRGDATAATGITQGVYGTASSTSGAGGAGVRGDATALTGPTSGVVGNSFSTAGTGVSGNALAATGANFGVVGTSISSSGTGVKGNATTASGVFGSSGSAQVQPQAGSFGVQGLSTLAAGGGVLGHSTDTTVATVFPPDVGVVGVVDHDFGYGVFGRATSTSTPAPPLGSAPLGPAGVAGYTLTPQGSGVYGLNAAGAVFPTQVPNGPETGEYGVQGIAVGINGVGVYGHAIDFSGTGTAIGVLGRGDNSGQAVGVQGSGTPGVVGLSPGGSLPATVKGKGIGVFGGGGVVGLADPSLAANELISGAGVLGKGTYGVVGVASNFGGSAAQFINNNTSGDVLELVAGSRGQVLHVTAGGDTIIGNVANQGNLIVLSKLIGNFGGAVNIPSISGGAGGVTISGGATIDTLNVTGSLTKPAGSFKIDHPLDPEHKVLYHSFVESPDMKNVYDGVINLDADGQAWVELPAYFEALNKDFRYQLTAIGAPAPNLYIAKEVHGNRFQIAGGKAGGKVSWQVTGIRHDAFAEKHRIRVEEEKPGAEQGFYLSPDSYGQPEEKGVAWARSHPAMAAAQEVK